MSLYRFYGLRLARQAKQRELRHELFADAYRAMRRRNLLYILFFVGLFWIGVGFLVGRWVVPLVKRLAGM